MMNVFKKIAFGGSLLLAMSLQFGMQSAEASSRANKKIGLSYGIFSDPGPSLSSYQLKYNLTSAIQLGGSYGKIGSLLTGYGVNAKYFVIPSWNFSPYVGAGFTMAKVNAVVEIMGESVDLDLGTHYASNVSVGFDHQSNIGFNVGAGVMVFVTPSIIREAIPYLPHFYFGWVF